MRRGNGTDLRAQSLVSDLENEGLSQILAKAVSPSDKIFTRCVMAPRSAALQNKSVHAARPEFKPLLMPGASCLDRLI